MKPERNVMKHKPTERPLSKAQGGSMSKMFSTKLRGSHGPLTPYTHMVSPNGSDERLRTDVPGNQVEPQQSNHGDSGSSGD